MTTDVSIIINEQSSNSMNKDKIIEGLNLKKFGSKGWLGSNDLICPDCGKADKAGILFINDGAIFSCMRCGIKTGVNQYLRKVSRADLIEKQEFHVSIESKVKRIGEVIEETPHEPLPIKKLPAGFKEIDSDEYLERRNFNDYHFWLFKPGVTRIDLRHMHQIIFQILDEDDRRVAWLGRSKNEKEWHKENLIAFKEHKAELKLRYDNSKETDFSSILGGIRDMTDKVDTLILVEGLFDKTNVDTQLKLNSHSSTKCLFTFGDSIKEGQIKNLKRWNNVKAIILLYDYNTIQNSKRYSIVLQKELDVDVKVCEIKEDKDPGIMTLEELNEVFEKSVDPLNYNKGKLNHGIQKERRV